MSLFGKFSFPVLAIFLLLVIYSLKHKFDGLCRYTDCIYSWFVLYKTKFGLRLRSVGEHPQAADTLVINVYTMRYAGVLMAGFLGGVGGAAKCTHLLISTSRRLRLLVSGFIALAAVIFGKWNPIGAMLASLFFGTITKSCGYW